MMARPGRKRKPAVARDRSGKIARPAHSERQQSCRQTALDARQRVLGLSKAECEDQRAASILGLLSLGRVVSDDELLAGQAFARLAGRFRAARQIKAPWPRAAGAVPYGEPPEMTPEQSWATHTAYCAAHDVLKRAGRLPMLAVLEAAIYDNAIPVAWHPDLKAGLKALHRHLC